MSADVLLYVTAACPYCRLAKELLRKKKAAFAEVDVGGRGDLRQWLVTATGQRTVPQVFVNGASLGGFSDIDRLDREGKLAPLLVEEPPAGMPVLPK